MTQSFYKGIDTYVIFAEDTAWGTKGVPTGTDYVDKVSAFSGNTVNNIIRVHGMGEGRNATSAVNGVLDVTGTIDWELTDPAFLQYCFVGAKAGAGTVGDPYEIAEVNEIGYAAGQVNTLTLKAGSNGGANDDEMTYDGVVFNNFTLTAALGETVKVSSDWTGRIGAASASIEAYTAPTNRPFTFVDGSLAVGTDVVGTLSNFTFTCANNMFIYRSMGSRLINQPVAGIRRYDFTITMKLHFDDAASVLSGLEARGIVFTGLPAGTTPADTATIPAVAVSLDLVEGAVGGDRVLNFDFENCYFESYSSPMALEDGVFEITITGFALAGLTDGSDKVPCRWYTIV